MNQDSSPITPPPELVQQWFLSARAMPVDQWVTDVATQAARWGADEQLQMDATWVALQTSNQMSSKRLIAEMRPKPPSLKDEVKQIIDCLIEGDCLNDEDALTLRRALESLPS